MTTPGVIDIEVALKEGEKDLFEVVKKNLEENTKYHWLNDRLLYKRRLVISKHSSLIPTLLRTFHDSILGHSKFLRTYKRMNGELHWEGMKIDIKNYVEQCDICQRNKTECSLFHCQNSFLKTGLRISWRVYLCLGM